MFFFEELISKMGKAATSDEFVSAFDTRLGDIVLRGTQCPTLPRSTCFRFFILHSVYYDYVVPRLPHAHITAKRNAEDEMLLSPKAKITSKEPSCAKHGALFPKQFTVRGSQCFKEWSPWCWKVWSGSRPACLPLPFICLPVLFICLPAG